MPPRYSNKCSVDGCKKPFLAKGFCNMHYTRFKKHHDPLVKRTVFSYNGTICKVEGCLNRPDTDRMCGKHYMRVKRYGNPYHLQSKEEAAQNRKKSQLARFNNTRQQHTYKKLFGRHEHRVIMEKKIGRQLTSKEIVHHIDGNQQNNSPGNLELMTQSNHIKAHIKEMIFKAQQRKAERRAKE